MFGVSFMPDVLFAALTWSYQMLREMLLLSAPMRGADINLRDFEGNTILHIVCMDIRDSPNIDVPKDIVEKLIEAGADVNVRNNENCLPMDALTGMSDFHPDFNPNVPKLRPEYIKDVRYVFSLLHK